MAQGDILWIDFPESNVPGREQQGQRPAIVIGVDLPGGALPTQFVIPMTSNLDALRFAGTVKVEPSQQNGLNSTSVALCFQLRAIDKKRVLRTAGTLEANDLSRVIAEVKRLLGIN